MLEATYVDEVVEEHVLDVGADGIFADFAEENEVKDSVLLLALEAATAALAAHHRVPPRLCALEGQAGRGRGGGQRQRQSGKRKRWLGGGRWSTD